MSCAAGSTRASGRSLFCRHGRKLDCLVRVLPPAGRAAAIEILLDVVPAESADLDAARCELRLSSADTAVDAPGSRTGMAGSWRRRGRSPRGRVGSRGPPAQRYISRASQAASARSGLSRRQHTHIVVAPVRILQAAILCRRGINFCWRRRQTLALPFCLCRCSGGGGGREGLGRREAEAVRSGGQAERREGRAAATEGRRGMVRMVVRVVACAAAAAAAAGVQAGRGGGTRRHATLPRPPGRTEGSRRSRRGPQRWRWQGGGDVAGRGGRGGGGAGWVELPRRAALDAQHGCDERLGVREQRAASVAA